MSCCVVSVFLLLCSVVYYVCVLLYVFVVCFCVCVCLCLRCLLNCIVLGVLFFRVGFVCVIRVVLFLCVRFLLFYVCCFGCGLVCGWLFCVCLGVLVVVSCLLLLFLSMACVWRVLFPF